MACANLYPAGRGSVLTAPGNPSGARSDPERGLAAQARVEIRADTLMIKLLAPGEVTRYLRGDVSAGEAGGLPPFDSRLVGGLVARAEDAAGLRTPVDFMRAFRVDYRGTPFRPAEPVAHIMLFRAVDPDRFVIPFGAPASPGPSAPEVRAAAYAMVDAASAAGLDPNSYRMTIAPWPFTGTGFTTEGLPERWMRPGVLPGGATILEHDRSGQRRAVATYRGQARGWERL